MAGCDEEENRLWCHFVSDSESRGEDGSSVGEEKDVEEEEEVMLEVSSAPEDVMSLSVFEGARCSGNGAPGV